MNDLENLIEPGDFPKGSLLRQFVDENPQDLPVIIKLVRLAQGERLHVPSMKTILKPVISRAYPNHRRKSDTSA